MTKHYSAEMAQLDLPTRGQRDNKTRGGKCLIVAGSSGQWSAGILCARAAARSGAGYTYVYDPKSNFPTARNPDFLITKNIKNLSQFSAVAIGPGFHNRRLIRNLIRRLIKLPAINVVLDAEALNALSELKSPLRLLAHWVLTPHEGELSRLIQTPSLQIKKNRKDSTERAQKKWGCVIVLKGFKTLITDRNQTWEIAAGNPALAKAGTGDVLTGIMAALLSQKVPAQKAACLAVYIHGKCAEAWVKSGNDPLSLLASDLVDEIPKTLNRIRNRTI